MTFAGGLVGSVSTYYRSNVDLNLFAYDAADNIIGTVSGPDNLAPDPEQYLAFNPGGIQPHRNPRRAERLRDRRLLVQHRA